MELRQPCVLCKIRLGQTLSFYKNHLCETSSGNLSRSFFKNLLRVINEGQSIRQALHSCVQGQNNFLSLVYQNLRTVSPPSVLQHSQHPRGWEAERNTALNTPLNPTRRSHLTFKYQKERSINLLLLKQDHLNSCGYPKGFVDARTRSRPGQG